MFESPFSDSILKRARDNNLVEIRCHDLREYTLDKHRRVDDYPFGGGSGMIMSVEPIARAIEEVKTIVKVVTCLTTSCGCTTIWVNTLRKFAKSLLSYIS